MQKFAQKRSILNKLREMTNVSGMAAETFFNPKFKEVMEHIRKKDDQIRSFVSGKRLGDAEVNPTGLALKDYLKQVKSNINRREFMTAAHDLVEFYEQTKNVITEISSINHKVDEVHNEFLFEQLTPEQQEKLIGLKTKFVKKQAGLSKEAGIMDFFHNIGTSRGRGLAAWEKRYPKKVNEIKDGLTSLLQRSESLFNIIIDSLKDMASARAVRNIDNYMRAANKIANSFNGYDKYFQEFYNKVFKKYIDDLEAYNARQVTENDTTQLTENDNAKSPSTTVKNLVAPSSLLSDSKDISADPDTESMDAKNVLSPPLHQDIKKPAVPTPPSPVNKSPSSPSLPTISYRKVAPVPVTPVATKPIISKVSPTLISPVNPVGDASDTIPFGPTEEMSMRQTVLPPPGKLPVISHQKFYSSLESLSSENPTMLALFINKYANSIRNIDSITAFKLFKIVKQIKG